MIVKLPECWTKERDQVVLTTVIFKTAYLRSQLT